MATRTRLPVALVALAGVAACGGEEPRTGALDAAVVGAQPPVIQYLRLEPAEPVAGDAIYASVKARDPDGDEVSIRYDWEIGGVPASESGPTITLGAVSKGTRVVVTATASDGVRTSDPASGSVTVRNRRPRLSEVRIEPWDKVALGETLAVRAGGVDPDGDELHFAYSWEVNGETVDDSGDSFSTASLAPGDWVQVHVTANDGDSDSDPIASARVRVVGSNPQIVSEPSGFASDGVYRYKVEVVHPDGDRSLRFELRSAPDGMTVDPISGQITWTPRSDQLGEHLVEVAVQDSKEAVTVQAFSLNVGAGSGAPANQSAW
jgi:hypothetical protein